MTGDHTHVFWACPKIQSYWTEIKNELGKIFRRDIQIEPQLALLDILQLAYDKEQVDILHILMMVARKMITINWMNPNPPTIQQWQQKIKQVYNMESLTAQLQMKMELFGKRWRIVADYLET